MSKRDGIRGPQGGKQVNYDIVHIVDSVEGSELQKTFHSRRYFGCP